MDGNPRVASLSDGRLSNNIDVPSDGSSRRQGETLQGPTSVKKGGPGFSVLPDRGEQIAQRVADLPFRRVASANAKPN
jgi:hypothetical protein